MKSCQLFTIVLIFHAIASISSKNVMRDIYLSGEVEEAEAVDFIIVGAGSAGSVLANKLTVNQPFSAVVIEAGSPDAVLNRAIHAPLSSVWQTELDWQYHTLPNKSGLLKVDGSPRSDYWPRGKVWGGSSSINAMLYVRGQPEDYDLWQQSFAGSNEEVSWNYSSCLPYFIQAERTTIESLFQSPFHGHQGPLFVSHAADPYEATLAAIRAYAEVLGLPFNSDYNGASQEAASLLQLTQKEGRRWSTADAFLKPALAAKNGISNSSPSGQLLGLDVQSNAQVTRVLLEKLGDGSLRAYGVEYVVATTGKTIRRNATRSVILSAGTINSPQLLMLSGIGPQQQLRDLGIPVQLDLPGVGENLQDHLIFPVTVHVNSRTAQTESRPSSSVTGGIFHRSSASLRAPDIQISIDASLWDGGLSIPSSWDIITLGPCLNRPQSRGSIRLKSSDPFTPPLIDPNYFGEESDLEAMVSALEITQRVLAKSSTLSPFVASLPAFSPSYPWGNCTTDDQRELYIRMKAHTSYHPAGTCKMGPQSDPMAVVNSQLQVHGVQGLRVVDASVMPRITSGNLNAPVIMIASRAADFILRDELKRNPPRKSSLPFKSSIRP